jgi:hypothetical protein
MVTAVKNLKSYTSAVISVLVHISIKQMDISVYQVVETDRAVRRRGPSHVGTCALELLQQSSALRAD